MQMYYLPLKCGKKAGFIILLALEFALINAEAVVSKLLWVRVEGELEGRRVKGGRVR